MSHGYLILSFHIQKAQFLAKVFCGSFLFAAITCFYHSISFTAYHKVYCFPFSENELRKRLANGYGTYNRSQRDQKSKRALMISDPHFVTIELGKFKQELLEKDTLLLLLPKSAIQLRCLVFGDSMQACLQILEMSGFRLRDYKRNKTIYEKKMLERITKDLIYPLGQK